MGLSRNERDQNIIPAEKLHHCTNPASGVHSSRIGKVIRRTFIYFGFQRCIAKISRIDLFSICLGSLREQFGHGLAGCGNTGDSADNVRAQSILRTDDHPQRRLSECSNVDIIR